MSGTIYPDQYTLLNQSNFKTINLVLDIDGAPDFITLQPLSTKVRYGDPGIFYGEPGLIYGGLRNVGNTKAYLNIDGGLSISQKIEPESGRSSVSTMTFVITDKNGYMSRLMAPGVVLNEPLGNKKIRVWLGFQNSSFPDDYFVVFRGYITDTTFRAGNCVLQTSDSTCKIRGNAFEKAQTVTTAPVAPTDTTINVVSTQDFLKPIAGPDGSFDPAVTCYIKIDDEWMSFPPGGFTGTSFTGVTRGLRGTPAASHGSGAQVEGGVQVQDNAINIALKLYLSGFGGPYISGITVRSINNALDPNVSDSTNSILIDSQFNAIRDLGLTIGDYFTITGSSAGNNGTFKIIDIEDAGGFSNVLLYTDSTLNYESPATGVNVAFRSQFDTLPDGFALTPAEVDTATPIALRHQFFANDIMQFFFPDAVNGKEFIESQCFQPIGIYSLTRYGQISCGFTRPPLAAEKLIQLDVSNIINPGQIQVRRAINNRRYYDQITYNFDMRDDGSFGSILKEVDQQALTNIQVPSVLEISSQGLKTSLGAAQIIANRARSLLNRYKNAAYEITLQTNFKAASLIETGDTVILSDPSGALFITNLVDGTRTIGSLLFEVIQRELNINSGTAKLTLLSNIGAGVTDRYAVISPSSIIVSGTSSHVRIKDSFGAIYPGNEKKKWDPIVGEQVWVHSPDFTTRSGIVTLQGFDPRDKYNMLFASPLAFTPQPGDIVDVAPYDTTSKFINPKSKLLFCYIDPTLQVVSGISDTQFTVSSGDAAKVVPGNPILIHNFDYSILSREAIVDTIIGTTVTVKRSLGFTPAAGQYIELVGFKDGSGAYRML